MEVLIVIAVVWVAPIFIAHDIGNKKGRAGLLYGIVLGWLGVLIIALLPPKPHVAVAVARQKQLGTTHRECPWCFEPMRREATMCPHCQHGSEKAPQPPPQLTTSQANWWRWLAAVQQNRDHDHQRQERQFDLVVARHADLNSGAAVPGHRPV